MIACRVTRTTHLTNLLTLGHVLARGHAYPRHMAIECLRTVRVSDNYKGTVTAVVTLTARNGNFARGGGRNIGASGATNINTVVTVQALGLWAIRGQRADIITEDFRTTATGYVATKSSRG